MGLWRDLRQYAQVDKGSWGVIRAIGVQASCLLLQIIRDNKSFVNDQRMIITEQSITLMGQSLIFVRLYTMVLEIHFHSWIAQRMKYEYVHANINYGQIANVNIRVRKYKTYK